MGDRYKWGLDLGGTKIEGVVVDSHEDYRVLARMRVPTQQQHGYEHIVRQIQTLIEQLCVETGMCPTAIGMGTPGIIDPKSGCMQNSNTQCLLGRQLQVDVEAATGFRFVITNDANCFAKAEYEIGVVSKMDHRPDVVFGVIMGTGVGGGLIVNGKVINGRHGIGGEWGHTVLVRDGLPCYCGKRGCVEKYIAGPALERHYASLSGSKMSLKDIARRHYDGIDPHATATIDRMVSLFGEAIANVVNVLDPDVIILGGGVGNIPDLHLGASEALLPYIFNGSVRTQFLRPSLGDSAGVFGAAMLV